MSREETREAKGRIELPSMVYETIALPLSYIGNTNYERVRGIEPTSQPWEGRILPLNHTRILLKPRCRIPPDARFLFFVLFLRLLSRQNSYHFFSRFLVQSLLSENFFLVFYALDFHKPSFQLKFPLLKVRDLRFQLFCNVRKLC